MTKPAKARNPIARPRKAAAAHPAANGAEDGRERYRSIHEHLKHAIAHGRLQAGLVLRESAVARLFGTSRAPAKKALDMLHAQGLLHRFDGPGYLVARHDGAAAEPVHAALSADALGLDAHNGAHGALTDGERIYDALEASISLAIVFGHFRINESDAARAFGVSRGAVREALNRLRDLGLVERSQSAHWLCGPLTARAVRHDYELRILLEPAALLASAPALARGTLAAARDDIARAIAAPESFDADAAHRLEITLHERLLSDAPNHKLLSLVNRAHLPLTVNHAFYAAFHLRPEQATLVEHLRVLDLLLADHPEAASDALAAHLRAGQVRTLQRLKSLSVLPEPTLPDYLTRIA
ncbi:GntR family transcriptional regulator [Burkholderia singularis]|uniref:GntR family transcriptional regulator n=1 Tax=Burkholderia singularis TaxID=1503053 RepID=A0A103E2D2_9BURK|nr:GntR family transcriptional regulator [Burkholderia singularis]KVE26905.1 GntR family transcriptional regulator [Burkholderia singularis]